MAVKKISTAELRKVITEVLLKYGIPKDDAVFIADSLLDAEKRGIASHGIMRLIPYTERLKNGVINVAPNISVEYVGNIIEVDGDNGLGPPVMYYALTKCMNLARQNAASIALVRHSNHFGAAGFYTRIAAKEGFIAFAASNAGPTMPPFGGTKSLLGTNPFSVSFPAGKYEDFTLDIAMSAVSKGKIRVFAHEGKEIPIGWAMDAEGKDTTDPQKAISGCMLPMGGYKGYGLAMAVDMLCGVLAKANLSCESLSVFDSRKEAGTGHFLFLIDIEKIMPIKDFSARVEKWFDELKSSPKRCGIAEILVPGEIENRLIKQNAEYIEVSEQVIKDIYSLLR